MLHRIVAAAALALAATVASAANPQVELDTTAGVIKLELYPEAAPKTVANFLDYVKSGHYVGTQFHRVIDGFMIQGGGFTTDFKEKPTKPPIPIESESSVKAGLSNAPGTIAMARTSDPNSATSQFFINVNNNARLNFSAPTPQGYGYTVFGKVIDGMDVVNKIAKAPKGSPSPVPPGINPADVPSTQVVIKSAKVIGG
jgi:peptidyl-prolyl cis-trans isomerase A (cyclophilin A)/peptidyl-prolyl cis-trans isomerase B (cyclophilin B)